MNEIKTPRQDINTQLESPIRILLNALPAGVYQEKWKAIKVDLHEADEFEHFRQSISRAGFDLGRTHSRAMQILMTHLGLSLEFFTAPPTERDKRMAEIARIVNGFAMPLEPQTN